MSSTAPLMACESTSVGGIPQVNIKAYFASLMEPLVGGDGLMERFNEDLGQKLEYLRRVEMQAEAYRASTSQRHGKVRHISLLDQLLASTLPDTGETLLHIAARWVPAFV